jgi:predicted ArsR family transcriptional regulator
MIPNSPASPLQRHKVAAVALLDEPTRRLLYDAVIEAGTLSRDGAAQRVGISRDLAAHHLDRLVKAGLLVASHQRLTGRTGPGAGRPAKIYARSSEEINVSLPMRRYDFVAETLAEGLEVLADQVGAPEVAAAVDKPAREHGREAGKEVSLAAGSRAGAKRRANELVKLLEDSGFEPATSADGASIRLGNCPYRTVAETHRDLTCGMNLAWAEGVLEAAGETGLSPQLDFQPGRCCVVFTKE